jgi:hypothetical protein
LHEVEQSVQRLVSRELIPLLMPYLWDGGRGFDVGKVELASNRLRIDVVHSAFPHAPARLEWLEEDGWLVANIRDRGWLDHLEGAPHRAVTSALAGLYKVAGMDVVNEHVRANLPRPVAGFELTPHDLVLWLDHRYGKAVYYGLQDLDGKLRPRTDSGEPLVDWPVIEDEKLIFSRLPITWNEWVENWQAHDRTDDEWHHRRINVDVLPNGQATTIAKADATVRQP